MKLFALLLIGLLGGCATEVYQEGKSREQTARDVKICEEHAKLVAPVNPVAALAEFDDCIARKGYKRRSLDPVFG